MSQKNFVSYGDAETVLSEFADSIKGKEPLTFKGTQAEWNALTALEKAKYTIVYFTDVVGEGGAVVVDEVTDGNLNPVTSNAVYNATPHQIFSNSFTVGGTLFTTPSAGIYAISIKAYVKAASDGDWNMLSMADNGSDFFHMQKINYVGGMYFDFSWCGYIGANHAVTISATSGAGTPTVEQTHAWVSQLGK